MIEDFLELLHDLAEEKRKKGYIAPTKAEVETNGETTPFSNIYVRAKKN